MPVYTPERKWPRLVPANSIMVSIYVGIEQAYGLIANISEAGACVVSGIAFKPGSKVLLRIGFQPEDEPFTTEAKVIWSRGDSESKHNPTFYHGVEFDLASEEQRSGLKSVLTRPDFQNPVIPGMSSHKLDRRFDLGGAGKD